MSTAYKAVDNALTSMAYTCGADPLTYTPGDTLDAAGLPGTAITDPINALRGITAFPTLAAAVAFGLPRSSAQLPIRYVELSYDPADVLATGTASTGGRFVVGQLSLKTVTVVDEVFP